VTDAATDRSVRELYRDDELLIVSKPSGLLVHRTAIAPDEDALLQRVRDHVGQYVYPVHRIDRGASGIVLFTLNPKSMRWVQRALRDLGATKEYLVLARGKTPDFWFSTRPLRSAAGKPQPSHSEFETIERFERCALVLARIYTGRSHQIRRHLNHSAHHVLGDTTYGKGRINREFRERFGLTRLFLHAHRVRLFQPRRGEWVDIREPLPPELDAVLARLRAHPDQSPTEGASESRPAGVADGSAGKEGVASGSGHNTG
jgi:tRNA pseudouridine65 synthase